MTAFRPCCRFQLCARLSTSSSSAISFQPLSLHARPASTASYPSEASSSSSSTSSSSHRARSSSSNDNDSSNQADPRKGKSRSNDLAQSYRFPEKGRLGGPPDPFEVLALERDASQAQVKQQYYKLALLLHPDSSHPSSSHDHFATLNRAYKLLSTPSSRNSYLKTGYGWTNPSSSSSDGPRPPSEYGMHAEILRRARGGTASWEKRRYRDSDAGRGAWGGFDGSQGWKPYTDHNGAFNPNMGFDTTATGTGEERYMSNPRFLAVVGIVGAAVAWMQFHRLGQATETHRDLLDRQNVGASQALAQARYEAAIHGKTRREQIRRRVREAEIMKELEMERIDAESGGGGGTGGHGRIASP
ncbi:hypothetical protein I316_00536 [Kwoniella heveanensis BCC8398]|uniref:J domain-containing protein n=1 Tax=Kwoniella heveanensis BCC8398 TaxID=1296120 RepID=A0A1B9H2B5_9TREE|nr:hypothetical protein I316_00536 [Kwoniella heveanensis BCC8398]